MKNVPPMLCLHLLRFDAEGHRLGLFVDFPFELVLDQCVRCVVAVGSLCPVLLPAAPCASASVTH